MKVVNLAHTMVALGTAVACGAQPPEGPAQRSPNPTPRSGVVRVDTIARGLVHPWGLAILDDGRFLVTERAGRMRVIDADGRLSPPLAGVPRVYARGQGGLLDVTLDPAFAANRFIYISYAEPGPGGTAGTSVARARLGAAALENLEVIYRQEPKVTGDLHFGSRIVFARDGTMFVTQGERFEHRGEAQELGSLLGKVVRIASDGSAPRDNPFASHGGVRAKIWSYGHRNVQAAALQPTTGDLWTVEHGARGGDELNHVRRGRNYGWPVITYGVDYSGGRIGRGAAREGMEQPVYYWDPVIAPSGMIFYTGDAFPQWRGSILVGGLASRALVRIELRDGRVMREERYLGDVRARIRDVAQGDDGFVYVITDESDGALLRIRPN